MILVLATANRDKGNEMASILRECGDLSVRPLSNYPHVTLPPEEGLTYRENAEQKAMSTAKAVGEWALGDDSGLEIEALNGAPGLYSARFAGEGVSYADNRRRVLTLLDNLPMEKRKARFICTIAISDPKGNIAGIAEGICEGEIAFTEEGQGGTTPARGATPARGFGYDPIFYLPEYGKTFAQVTPEEKNQVSHRGKALRAALAVLKGVSKNRVRDFVSGCGAGR